MTQIIHDADCGSFRVAYPTPCDCSASQPRRQPLPRLTIPQRRLLDRLQPIGNGRWHRYSTANMQRGRGLVSVLALWRRGYVCTDDYGRPDAFENRDRGLVHLTAQGEQLLAQYQTSENKS